MLGRGSMSYGAARRYYGTVLFVTERQHRGTPGYEIGFPSVDVARSIVAAAEGAGLKVRWTGNASAPIFVA